MNKIMEFLRTLAKGEVLPAWRKRRMLEKHSRIDAGGHAQEHPVKPLVIPKGRTEFETHPARVDMKRPGWARKRDRRREA